MSHTALKLFGTAEVEPPLRHLRAGPLSATLDRGGLRWVRWREVEILRGLLFLVRNAGWGTPPIEIRDLEIETTAERFRVAYRGEVLDGKARLSLDVEIQGFATGELSAWAKVKPRTEVVTNRTGFVVLHPIDGFAGADVAVDHGGGDVETVTIPTLISPAQPVRDIRGLRYETPGGVTIAFRFKGEVFEMEDQRNWTDASFKTYSRPLDWPRPFTLKAGMPFTQAVRMTVSEVEVATRSQPKPKPDKAVLVRIGEETGVTLPRLGLALPSDLAAASLAHAETLRALAADHLNVRLDLSDPDRGTLADVARLSAATALPVSLDILLMAEADPRAEITAVAAELAEAGLRPRAVAAFPKIDEGSFQPGEARPPSPSFESIHAALRAAFPDAIVTGGTPAFFTELNRKRPVVEGLDVIAHGTCAIVHAADDRSVMETLQSLSGIIGSTRAFGGGRPIRIGPIAIGARINPYGSGPEPNPGNGRVGLTGVDPRQRGLFGAAWHVGYAAAIAPHGIDSLVVGATIGPFGLVHARQDHAQPWFDEAGKPAVFPLFHAVADLARGGGKLRRTTDVSDETRVAALAWSDDAQCVLMLANLTGEIQSLRLEGVEDPARIRILDEASFEDATLDWLSFVERSDALDGEALVLRPYAVATIAIGKRGA